MEAFYIREWTERYDVTDQDRTPKNGVQPKKKPLEFVRLPARGKSRGPGYQKMCFIAGSEENIEAVMCVFVKLLEIAAQNTREYRGWILDENNKPASFEDIHLWTGYRIKTIESAFKVMSDKRLRWIEKKIFTPYLQNPAGTSRKLQEPTGTSADLQKTTDGLPCETETETETETYTETQTNTKITPEPQKAQIDDSEKINNNDNSSSDSLNTHQSVSYSGSDSSKKADNLARLKIRLQALQKIPIALGYSGREKTTTQFNADQSCFKLIANFIGDGKLGPPEIALELALAEAVNCASKKGIPIAIFQTWIKNELAKHGHAWIKKTTWKQRGRI